MIVNIVQWLRLLAHEMCGIVQIVARSVIFSQITKQNITKRM